MMEPPERVWGIIATENYFDVLGVHAAIGRTFHAQPNQALNSDPYIVLSQRSVEAAFGSDPNVVGRTVHINGHPFTVIGVAPPHFFGTIVGIDAQYFVPMMMQPRSAAGREHRGAHSDFRAHHGTAEPGVSIAQAQAELTTIAGHLAQEYPDPDVGNGVACLWRRCGRPITVCRIFCAAFWDF